MRKDKVQVGRLAFGDRAGRPAGQAAARLEQSRPSTGAGAFTKGPWKAYERPYPEKPRVRLHWADDDHITCPLVAEVNAGLAEANANAHLIAAAPELFEALADFERSAALIGNTASEVAPEQIAREGARAWHRCLINARAALSKALGHPSGDS